MREICPRKAFVSVCFLTLLMLFFIGAFIYIVDPFYHYRGLNRGKLYPTTTRFNERYVNDGIIKHYDYNAMIIGTSMTENFKTSEFDSLFHLNSIKVPAAGASYKEINERLETAVKYNGNIKMILRCLDYDKLLDGPDDMRFDESYYPTYLYNDFLLDDVKYLWNKKIAWNALEDFKTLLTQDKWVSFDDYANWQNEETFGKEAIVSSYERTEQAKDEKDLTTQERNNIRENLYQNVIQIAEENSGIDFFYFFSPYSIYYWDSLNQSGELTRQLEAEKYAIELLLGYDNIHIYSFFNEYEVISNSNNYKDIRHYSEDINSQILVWIKDGHDEITVDNYKEYLDREKQFYCNYDYEKLFSDS